MLMRQLSLASPRVETSGRRTTRRLFLTYIDRVVPWSALCELNEKMYLQNKVVLLRAELEWMLRIYFLQA